jgi:hypothetical protein
LEAPVRVTCGHREATLRPVPYRGSRWSYLSAPLDDCPENAPVALRVSGGAYRDFHLWLLGR